MMVRSILTIDTTQGHSSAPQSPPQGAPWCQRLPGNHMRDNTYKTCNLQLAPTSEVPSSHRASQHLLRNKLFFTEGLYYTARKSSKLFVRKHCRHRVVTSSQSRRKNTSILPLQNAVLQPEAPGPGSFQRLSKQNWNQPAFRRQC